MFFSARLDEDDSAELDAIISELRDFKVQFEECANLRPSSSHQSKSLTKMNHKIESSLTHGCVYELQTLEDQLEAALASLTLTINDCTNANIDVQQRSSGSSACSSGLGDDIANESLNLSHVSNSIQNGLFTSKKNIFSNSALITDDCDSAFSDSGSSEKITSSSHQDETVRPNEDKKTFHH